MKNELAVCDSLSGSATPSHTARTGQGGEEADESEYKTSFLSNVNNTNTTGKIPVVVLI